jgi:hypothetical protein
MGGTCSSMQGEHIDNYNTKFSLGTPEGMRDRRIVQSESQLSPDLKKL